MANKITVDKSTLETFISKYHLGGNIESVIWTSDGKKLQTRFVSDSRSLLGSVILNNFITNEELELGIYSTSKLVRLLSVILNKTIDMKVVSVDDKARSIELMGDGTNIHFNLSSLDVIPSVPKQKEIPKFETSIKVTPEFVDRFLRGCAALPEVTTFFVNVTKDSAKVTIGYTSVPSNSVVIDVETQLSKPMENVTFPANMMKEVFAANKGSDSATLEISEKGLAKAEFVSGDFKSTYYIVSVEEGK